VLDRVDRRLRGSGAGARVRVARELVAQIRGLTRQINGLQRELRQLVQAHRPQLLAETGCAELSAALLIGRTAGAERFKSDAGFARPSGSAPIPCSSGQRTQHRLNRGGDRQLNLALHTIALTRANHDPATKQYLHRKRAEGKTEKGALRSLKRHLARRFHRLLSQPPLPPPAAPAQPSKRVLPKTSTIPPRPAAPREVEQTSSAPVPMVCIT
jgi:transposase